MYASPSPFAEFHQAGMEALMEFAHGQFAVFERLSALNFNLARSAFHTANAALGSLTEYGMKTSELAQAKLAAVNSGIVDADAESDRANSKTGRDSKGGNDRRQARKSTRRKAA
jgi:hypothetical protein